MACVRVQEGKGLDVKPPDLGVGGGLPLLVHRDGASQVIQRVGTSTKGGGLKSCSVTYIISVISSQ